MIPFGSFLSMVLSSSGDDIAPTVSTISIEDDGATDTIVRVTWAEDIDPGSLDFSGNFTLTASGGAVVLSGPTWASAKVLEIDTDRPILASETCVLTIAAAAVEDLAGNANELLTDAAVTNNSTRYPSAEEIATELVSPTKLTHCFFLGDSRTASISRFLDQNCPQVIWGGMRIPMQALDTVGHDAQASGITAGDNSTTSPHVGGNINSWCPYEAYEVEFTGTNENGSGSNSLLSRCYYPTGFGPTQANYPNFWDNAQGNVAKFRALYYRHGGSTPTTQPGITAHWRVSGNNFGGVNTNSAYTYDFSGSGYGEITCTIPDTHDWTTYTTASPELTAQPLTATTAGEVVAFAATWVETETGLVMHDWSVGGRSVDGWLDSDVFDPAMFSTLIPLFGENRMLWIDLGQNNPATNNTAAHKAKIISLIEAFRVGSPGASVILTTSYAASGDGSTTYYADAHREIADEVSGVLLIDTFAAMPSYTEGNSLGYYTDTVHFNDTGRAAWCNLVGHLVALKAGTFTIDDLGLDLFLRISGDDVNSATPPDIEQANDSSGEASHLAQSTGANKPDIVTGWRNGRNAVAFDGTDFLFRATFTSGEITQPYTTWDVFETPSSGTSSGTIAGGKIAGGLSKRGDLYFDGAGKLIAYSGSGPQVGDPYSTSTPAIVEVLRNGASSKSVFTQHGQAEQVRTGFDVGSQAYEEPYWGSQDAGAGGYVGTLAARIGARGEVVPQHRYVMREYLKQFYDIQPV